MTAGSRSLLWVLVGVLLLVSAVGFNLPGGGLLPLAALALLLAWLLLGLLLYGHTLALESGVPIALSPGAAISIRWWLVGAGAAALGVLTAINAFVSDIHRTGVSAHIQLALLVGGIALVVAGLGGRQTAARTQGTPVTRRTWAALAGLTGLALLLRLWHLEDAVHFFVDELNFGLPAKYVLLHAPEVALLRPFSGVVAFPYLYPYLQTQVMTLVGINLSALRLLSVLLGTLSVPAVFLLARELFPARAAAQQGTAGRLSVLLPLLAAALLAVYPPHVHFSRIGLNNIADPLFGTLALALLLRGWRLAGQAGSGWAFALGGAALGLTQYFYEGGKAVYPVIVLALGAVLLLALLWRRGRWGGRNVQTPGAAAVMTIPWRGLGVYALAALIVAAPPYLVLIANGAPLFPRMTEAGIYGNYWQRQLERGVTQTFDQHLLRPLLVYVYQRDRTLFYGGGQPLLLMPVVPFFLLGVGLVLWRLVLPGDGKTRYLIPALWLGVVSLGNMLLADSASYARFVVGFPMVVLLAALGIVSAIDLLQVPVRPARARAAPYYGARDVAEVTPGGRGWRGLTPQGLQRAVITGVTALLCLVQVAYYWGDHLPLYNYESRPELDAVDALFRSQAFPPGTGIHMVALQPPDLVYLEMATRFILDDLANMTVMFLTSAQFTPDYIAALPRNVDHAFYVSPFDESSVRLIEQNFLFGSPQFSPFPTVPWDRQFVLYYVAAADQPGANNR